MAVYTLIRKLLFFNELFEFFKIKLTVLCYESSIHFGKSIWKENEESHYASEIARSKRGMNF